MRLRGRVLAATAAAALGAPAAGQAAISHVGSDLSGAAGVAIQRTEDTALAQLTSPGGGAATAPHGGQVLSVRVIGCSQHDNVPEAPETRLFVQVLQPQGDGSELVISSSQPFDLPICGRGADHGTTSTFAPSHQCISRGDRVGLVVGGQTPGYPNGTQYFIARSSAGAALGAFSRNSGAVNGARFTFAPIGDTELLMQAAIGSGSDSPSGCASDSEAGGGGGGGGGGGPAAPTSGSVVVAKPATANRRGKATVALGCTLAAGDTCRVALVLFRGSSRVGTVAGAIPGGEVRALPVRLNKAGKNVLRRKRKLSGTLRGTVRGHGGKATFSTRLTVKR
jgi:hypothetical protein